MWGFKSKPTYLYRVQESQGHIERTRLNKLHCAGWGNVGAGHVALEDTGNRRCICVVTEPLVGDSVDANQANPSYGLLCW